MNTKKYTDQELKEHRHRHYLENKEKVQAGHKIWKGANKEKVKTYAHEAHKTTKLRVLSHYSNGQPICKFCQKDDMDVLCIDHINGGGTKQRKQLKCPSSTSFYKWLEQNNYPEGYQVLCANCNLKKRMTKEKC